jgi:TonB family protein
VEGTVALHVTIAADGSVKDVAVVNGDARLTSAAVDAVKKWRFQPFSADDKPVEGQRDVTVNFKLAEPADTETRLDDSTDPIAKKGSAGVTRPQIIHSPDPEYTKAALDAHVDGLLALSLVVGSDGKPRDIKVARSLGYGLDETGIEAVRQWRFKPATQDGKPVAVSIVVEVPFRR